MAQIGKNVKFGDLKHYWTMYAFIAPTLILLCLFQYYPAASGVFHSLFRWNGADVCEYVGFGNYFDLLSNHDFWKSFELAFTLGVWNIVKMAPALLVAVCLHRVRSERLQFLYRIFFVIQMVIPGLVLVLIWRSFFFEATSGYLNKFLHSTGFIQLLVKADQFFGWGGIFTSGNSPAWLGDPKLIVVACRIWGFPWVGSFAILNYLARLQSIPKDIYEAAEIDGTTWWTKFTQIEFPLITGSIKLILILVVIDTIKDAGMILALAGLGGGPGGNATVPALFMLRKAFIDQDMGYACAVGIVLTIIVMSLQKLSSLLTEWNEMPPRRRSIIRFAAMAAGLSILATGRFKAVAGAIVLASFPYAFFLESVSSLIPLQAFRPDTAPERFLHANSNMCSWGRSLRVLKHAAIIAVICIAFLPIYLMTIVSLKDNDQFYSSPAVLTQPLHWENWSAAFEAITPCLSNSVVISVASTILTLFVALSASYFFARYRMPLSGFLWNAILVLMMMPSVANLIPLFRLLRDLNMLNTLSALVVVGTSGGQIFAIFVLRSFVEDIPKDLFEAAEMDGASQLQQMMMIVVPLAGPILGTVGVKHDIGQWNDFVLPHIVMRDHARLPVLVELIRMSGEYIKLWGPLMAGYAMASIPVIILFVFTMKLFSRGLTEGGVKG